MNNIKALVSCTVLSLQDSSFVYPSCKCCLSRLTHEHQRATCARCGFTCDLQNVDHRYRLSVKASRNQDIFGVTVFGGCLNPFFGITAGELQRYIGLEKSTGPHSVQQLLTKAVEDCFIGRCVVLGLKVSHDDILAEQETSSLVPKSRQLVACQLISQSEAFEGLTVFGYFQNLLQSNSPEFESTRNGTCLSQRNDSQSSQRDELSSFDSTLPSCARLNSLLGNEEFTLSKIWQSPGLCCTLGEISNDSLKQYKDFDFDSLSPKNEDTKTCESKLDQLKHVDRLQDKLTNETQSIVRRSLSENETQSSVRRSLSENDSEIMISSHYLLKALVGKQYEAPFDNSCLCDSGQNICLDLEDAPLSEDVLDFVGIDPQLSEISGAKQRMFTDEHNSSELDEIIQEQNTCPPNNNLKLKRNTSAIKRNKNSIFPVMCNVNNKRLIKKNEIDKDYLENTMKNANIPKTTDVLCTSRFSSQKKKKMILADLNMNSSTDVVPAFDSPKDNRLCFSNRMDLTLQRKRLTRSMLSEAFCSLNHEENKHFRHCVESGIHSVKCKVKQEETACDDHGDTYNCSADLFVSCQNRTDMNQSDVMAIPKVNKSKNVNTSEPGVSGMLPFSPCLQSTPVSFHHTSRRKTGRSYERVETLNSKRLSFEFKSDATHVTENKPEATVSELDRWQIVGVTERILNESDVRSRSNNSAVNVDEWSRDLFENCF